VGTLKGSAFVVFLFVTHFSFAQAPDRTSPKPQLRGYPHVTWVGPGQLKPGDGYGWFTYDAHNYQVWQLPPCPKWQFDGPVNIMCWTADVSIRLATGYMWEATNNPDASNFWAVPLPAGSPHEEYANVVWVGDAEHIRPDQGYEWDNPGDPNDYRVSLMPKQEDLCHQAVQAQLDHTYLMDRIGLSLEVIQKLGFNKTREEIESWAQLGEQARKSYEETAQSIVWDWALLAVEEALRPEFASSLVRAGELSDKLVLLLEKANVPRQDDLYGLARSVRKKMSRREAEKLTKQLERRVQILETGKAIDEFKNLEVFQALLSVASVVRPAQASAFGFLILDPDTLSMSVYGLESEAAKHQIENLGTLTEGGLKLLKTYTDQLKNYEDSLSRAKRTLKEAISLNCNLPGLKLDNSTP